MTSHLAISRSRALLGSLLALVVSAPSARAAEVVVSYDGKRHLINKDVGGERWAITQNLTAQTATGNVFFPAGGEPRFVWCEEIAGGTEEVAMFSCWGADRCAAAPCSQDEWVFLNDVTLPRSFFAPSGDVLWVPIDDTVILPISFFEPPSATASSIGRSLGGARESGVQITRDGTAALISKDVGAERWAITRNFDDSTVTGNVFFSDGREPAFLWCEEIGREGDEVGFECRIADTETLGPIPDAPGNYFVNPLTGDDDNPGTRAEPFETINGALDGTEGEARIYVAGGIYDELVVLRSRAELFGSFNPSTWIRERASFPSIIRGGPFPGAVFGLGSAQGGVGNPLAVYGVEIAATTLDGFTIEAPDGLGGSVSSIGIYLREAIAVTVSRNTIVAGSGVDGFDGQDGADGDGGANGGRGSNAAVCLDPNPGGGGGGNGGDGGSFDPDLGVTAGEDGEDGGGFDGGPGGPGRTGDGGAGGPGGPPLDGVDGIGFDFFGFVGESAFGGPTGSGGGGGGAGGGVFIPPAPPFCGAGGGGGGGGGEGGGPGGDGGRGGGSFGVIVDSESDVEITRNLIVTGDGGNGGAGGLGGAGGEGGAGASGGSRFGAQGAGGRGGDGGDGGSGGDGGGGGGGPSIGILIDEDATAIHSGNSFEIGEPGLGGRSEEAPPGTYGVDGFPDEVYELAEQD